MAATPLDTFVEDLCNWLTLGGVYTVSSNGHHDALSLRIGIVEEVGSSCVLKVGDRVGWGALNSTCASVATRMTVPRRAYGSKDYDLQGTVCSYAVRKEQWLFKIPESLSSEDAAPLMCGGGTVLMPLIDYCKPCDRIGIVSVDGLGHLAIQFTAKWAVISSSFRLQMTRRSMKPTSILTKLWSSARVSRTTDHVMKTMLSDWLGLILLSPWHYSMTTQTLVSKQRKEEENAPNSKMVKTFSFGDIQVPSPGFGAMGLSFGLGSNLSYKEAEPVLLKAVELGCTFWDTAAVYAAGVNEKLLGDFIRKHNVRDKIFIASKCGFNVFGDGSVTNSAAHIKEYIEGTIERLGFTPDLYYLHRIDPKTPLEESIPALDEIRRAGKTKYIGLSECAAATLRKANSIAKIDAVQAEYSAFETIHERDGLIETAKELGVAYVAYSPLGHGWLVDNFDYKSPDDFAPDDFRRKSPKFQGENFYKNRAIVEEIKSLASKKGVTTPQIALAWVAAQGMIAIPGTTKPKRLEENWASREIEFTQEEFQEMRKIIDASKPAGNRYAPAHQAMVGH